MEQLMAGVSGREFNMSAPRVWCNCSKQSSAAAARLAVKGRGTTSCCRYRNVPGTRFSLMISVK